VQESRQALVSGSAGALAVQQREAEMSEDDVKALLDRCLLSSCTPRIRHKASIHNTDWVPCPGLAGGPVHFFLYSLSGYTPTFCGLIAGRCSSCQPWALDDIGRSISASLPKLTTSGGRPASCHTDSMHPARCALNTLSACRTSLVESISAL